MVAIRRRDGRGDHGAAIVFCSCGLPVPAGVIAVAVRGICVTACPTATWRSYSAARGIARGPGDGLSVGSDVHGGSSSARRERFGIFSGDRWFVDETYGKIAGRWTYLCRAVNQHGQAVDVLVSVCRDRASARAFFAHALSSAIRPVELTTDRAPTYP